MFCGKFLHTLDEKNRFKVPASLRNKIGVEAYLIQSPDKSTKCVYLYSEDGWERVCEGFAKSEVHDEHTRRESRRILSEVVYAEIDKGGRLTLNGELKNFAKIENDIYIVGNRGHIELWSPEEWAKEYEVIQSTPPQKLNIDF